MLWRKNVCCSYCRCRAPEPEGGSGRTPSSPRACPVRPFEPQSGGVPTGWGGSLRVKRSHALLEKLFIEGTPVGKDDFRDKPLIPISGCPGKRDDLDPLFPCPLAGEARCLAGIILGRGILGAFLRGIDSGKPDALSRIKHKRVSVRTLRHGG